MIESHSLGRPPNFSEGCGRRNTARTPGPEHDTVSTKRVRGEEGAAVVTAKEQEQEREPLEQGQLEQAQGQDGAAGKSPKRCRPPPGATAGGSCPCRHHVSLNHNEC